MYKRISQNRLEILNCGFKISTALLAGLLASGWCIAQSGAESDEETAAQRWFQIEVLIFTQPESADTSEIWRTDLALGYPDNWIALKDPDQPPVGGDLPPIEGLEQWTLPDLDPPDSPQGVPDELDEFGEFEAYLGETPDSEQQDSEQQDSEQQDSQQQYSQQQQEPLQVTDAEHTGTINNFDSTDTSTGDSTDTSDLTDTFNSTDTSDTSALTNGDFDPSIREFEPIAYYLLEESERKLNTEAARLRRSSGYRLLFHEAWRQPVLEESVAPFVLVSAGGKYGEHSELEGSFSVSVSRYLHLRTNLWFTKFTEYFGQDSGEWPQLPVKPDTYSADFFSSSESTGFRSAGSKSSAYSSATRPDGAESAFSGSGSQNPPADAPYPAGTPSRESGWPLPDMVGEILASPYIPERITKLTQRRRMRSGEIHYIDHPHIGLIILCTPFEKPEEEQPEGTARSAAVDVLGL